MPAALDLFGSRIDAGLGLEQALTRVAAEMGVSAPDIADELSAARRRVASRPASG